MLRGILWDNDGVLVNTEHLFYLANRELLRMYGLDLSEKQFFDWYLCMDLGAWHLLKEAGIPEDQFPQLRQKRNEIYTEMIRSSNDLAIPGIGELLRRLQGKVKMGVVTSSYREHYDAIHEGLDLNRHFEFVVSSGDYQNSKPSPEPYLLGLKKMGLSASQCIVVEDSPRGLQAAITAGIRCIILRNPMMHSYPFTGAYKIADSVDLLNEELQKLLHTESQA